LHARVPAEMPASDGKPAREGGKRYGEKTEKWFKPTTEIEWREPTVTAVSGAGNVARDARCVKAVASGGAAAARARVGARAQCVVRVCTQ